MFDNESVNITLLGYIPDWAAGLLWCSTIILCLETILGNILVLLSFYFDRSLRQCSNYLIGSLAISDLIIGLEGFPILTLYVSKKEQWILGKFFCNIWLTIDYTLCLVSIFTVFLITIDRYFSVCYAARYRQWQTNQKMKIFIAISWIAPFILFAFLIFGWELFTGDSGYAEPPLCYAPFLDDAYLNMAMYIAYYWSTLLAMMYLYRGIHKVARVVQKRADQREKQAVAMAALQRCMAQMGVSLLMASQPRQTQIGSTQQQDAPPHDRIHDSGYCSTLTAGSGLERQISVHKVQTPGSTGPAEFPGLEEVPETTDRSPSAYDNYDPPSPLKLTITSAITEEESESAQNSSQQGRASVSQQSSLQSSKSCTSSFFTTCSGFTECTYKTAQSSLTLYESLESSEPAPTLNMLSPLDFKLDLRLVQMPTDSSTVVMSDTSAQSPESANSFVIPGVKSKTPSPDFLVRSTSYPKYCSKQYCSKKLQPCSSLSPSFAPQVSARLLRTKDAVNPVATEFLKSVTPESTQQHQPAKNLLLAKQPICQKTSTISCISSATTKTDRSRSRKDNVYAAILKRFTGKAQLYVSHDPYTDDSSSSQHYNGPQFSRVNNQNTIDTIDRAHGKVSDTASWFTNLFQTHWGPKKLKQNRAARRARKAFRTITIILGTFALFWSPYFVFATIYGFCNQCIPSSVFILSYYMCYLNSSVNPFCYAAANRQFRLTFLRILRGQFWQNRRASVFTKSMESRQRKSSRCIM